MVDLYEMLKKDEHCILEMYTDSEDYFTIGVGHLITKNSNRDVAIETLDKEVGRKTNGVITNDESEKLFKNDVSTSISSIGSNSTLTEVYKGLDPIRKMALVNMVFQMGAQGVSQFTKSLNLLKEKKWSEAAKELSNSKWHSQTPNRSNRVISVFETGTLGQY